MRIKAGIYCFNDRRAEVGLACDHARLACNSIKRRHDVYYCVYDMPRSMLDIEVTESALNDNVGHIRAECDKLKAMGYHIWLDDFGSGYSSLNVLANYSFDVLKLDLVFLRSREKNPNSGAMMRYIIDGARGMKLLPLCEGVETEEQLEFLREAGCEFAQGYYIAKPMPMEESRLYTRAKGLKWEKV